MRVREGGAWGRVEEEQGGWERGRGECVCVGWGGGRSKEVPGANLAAAVCGDATNPDKGYVHNDSIKLKVEIQVQVRNAQRRSSLWPRWRVRGWGGGRLCWLFACFVSGSQNKEHLNEGCYTGAGEKLRGQGKQELRNHAGGWVSEFCLNVLALCLLGEWVGAQGDTGADEWGGGGG